MMNRAESWERFSEGLKSAADSIRQLCVLKKTKKWEPVAKQLDIIRENGRSIYQRAPISHAEAMRMLETQINEMRKKEEAAATDKVVKDESVH